MSVPVDENVVEPELKDEGLKMLLHLEVGVLAFLPWEDVKCLYRPTIHVEELQSGNLVTFSRETKLVRGES